MVLTNTEAVWIDDGVSDINGVLIGWLDATNDAPGGKTDEFYKIVYKPPVSANRSIIYKVLGGFAKALFKATNSEKVARTAFEVSDNIYPKSAIDGFPNGKTIDNIDREVGTPEKKVILREDAHGHSAYADKVWSPDGESVAQLKQKINDLKQRLQAEESENEELREEAKVDDKKRSKQGRYEMTEAEMMASNEVDQFYDE